MASIRHAVGRADQFVLWCSRVGTGAQPLPDDTQLSVQFRGVVVQSMTGMEGITSGLSNSIFKHIRSFPRDRSTWISLEYRVCAAGVRAFFALTFDSSVFSFSNGSLGWASNMLCGLSVGEHCRSLCLVRCRVFSRECAGVGHFLFDFSAISLRFACPANIRRWRWVVGVNSTGCCVLFMGARPRSICLVSGKQISEICQVWFSSTFGSTPIWTSLACPTSIYRKDWVLWWRFDKLPCTTRGYAAWFYLPGAWKTCSKMWNGRFPSTFGSTPIRTSSSWRTSICWKNRVLWWRFDKLPCITRGYAAWFYLPGAWKTCSKMWNGCLPSSFDSPPIWATSACPPSLCRKGRMLRWRSDMLSCIIRWCAVSFDLFGSLKTVKSVFFVTFWFPAPFAVDWAYHGWLELFYEHLRRSCGFYAGVRIFPVCRFESGQNAGPVFCPFQRLLDFSLDERGYGGHDRVFRWYQMISCA